MLDIVKSSTSRVCRVAGEEWRSSFAVRLFTARSRTKWLWRVLYTFYRNFVEPLFIDLRAYEHRVPSSTGNGRMSAAEFCEWVCGSGVIQLQPILSLKMNEESELIINLLHSLFTVLSADRRAIETLGRSTRNEGNIYFNGFPFCNGSGTCTRFCGCFVSVFFIRMPCS